MKLLLKEPLVHFLLVGVVLFAAYSLLSARDETPRDAIIVSAGKIEHLSALFTRTWQRPPSRTELEGLIAASSDLILLLRDNLEPGAANGRPLIKLQDGFWELTDDYPNLENQE